MASTIPEPLSQPLKLFMVNSLFLFLFLHQPTTTLNFANVDFEPDQPTLYICLSALQIYMDGRDSGAAVSTVASQEEGHGFDPRTWGLAVRSSQSDSRASSHSPNTCAVNGCLLQCIELPTIQGVTRPSPCDSWERLLQADPEETRREDGFLWMLCFALQL